ncbi:MAG: glycoside hydrolase family 38 [Chthoniobacteraceae bacterium]
MQSARKLIFHLLPNAHLDPVWLWDWREGLNEGLTTVKTVLNLMDEFPKLTFIRGEAAIYEHIEKTDMATFVRLRKRVEEGRWDVVGGTCVQPDSNLPGTETLCRNFEHGLAYFKSRFGLSPKIAWQADSFGHTAGWPNILRSFGMEGFTFTRPQRAQFPMDSPAFWWNCDGNDRLLCYRQYWKWYCSERANLNLVLDETLDHAQTDSLENVGVLMGLGNHGGGPTRRHLGEVLAWADQHPEVDVRFSTLHGFFHALRAEVESKTAYGIPSVRGELGYCLRGCYSSVQKFKSLFRQAEANVASAEMAQAFIGLVQPSPFRSLHEAWSALAFNSFHDILPGSSIERAFEDQAAWVAGAMHQANQARFEALNALARRVNTQVPPPSAPDEPTEVPFLVWNPLPYPFKGQVEVEASLDYRPIFEYENRPGELPFTVKDANGLDLPFQEVSTEHLSMVQWPWRKRVVMPLEIPACGWRVIRMGKAEEKALPISAKDDCTSGGKDFPWIANDLWKIGVDPQKKIKIEGAGGTDFFSEGRGGIQLRIVEDVWGSWGGMDEEPESYLLDHIIETLEMVESHVLEGGPERSAIWTRWAGKHSWIDLTFYVARGVPWITVHGRLMWNERSARLQLVIPSRGAAVCDVPGSVVSRECRGQTPVGRWFRRQNSKGKTIGIASDVLGDTDFLPEETRLTLARASRYASDVPTPKDDQPWLPAVDCGELKFRLSLFTDGISPDKVADALLFPPVALMASPSKGDLPEVGSLGEVFPATVRLLSAQLIDSQHLSVRLHNRGGQSCEAKVRIGMNHYSLGILDSQEIATFELPSR